MTKKILIGYKHLPYEGFLTEENIFNEYYELKIKIIYFWGLFSKIKIINTYIKSFSGKESADSFMQGKLNKSIK